MMKASCQSCCPNTPGPIAENADRSTDYDVVIVGGALSGSSSALLLKRRFPDLKVLIVEKSEIFDRKVGESTSEVAGCFLTRVLKIGRHLALNHVSKHGLRMWFHRDSSDLPSESTEIGPPFQGRLPTFQLNRRTLDAHLLEEAEMLGCELARPATISDLQLEGIGKNTITYKQKDAEPKTITAGWVIDASGKAAVVARKKKMWHSITEEHPVSSMWTRFRNVCDLDSPEGVEKLKGVSKKVFGQRGFSTNHLMGYGWWSWIIPLDNGEVSVGLTWDERIFTPPKDGSMSERLKEHLMKHPVGKMMFQDSVAVENDNRYYKGLAYYSDEVAGEGWTIAGDATGFMDPLYSQGIDFCGHTIYSSYALIRKYYSGECIKEELMNRADEFRKSYFYWFDAIYRDKYFYIGDSELMYSAFLLDLASYFLGPVRLVYGDQETEFSKMPFDGPAGVAVGRYMGFYNRRLSILARKKVAAGKYGDRNFKHSYIVPKTFTTGMESVKLNFLGLRIWLWAELRYLFVKPAPIGNPTMSTPLPEKMMNSSSDDSPMSKDPVLSEG